MPSLRLALALALTFLFLACHREPAAEPAPTTSAVGTPAPTPPDPPISVAGPEVPAAPEGHIHDWNEMYKRGIGFNDQPNALLVQSVEGVRPGKALDIGMGQGRNAVFLAKKGWEVTGIDTAADGIEIARQNAAAVGVKIDGRVQDMETYDLGQNRWDLIALIYMGDRKLADRITQALRPGGRVVIEFFHADADDYFPHAMNGFKTGELESLFPKLKVLRSDVVEDVADFGERPAKLVRFVAQKI
jgi:SAM-dependent methyltransferase